MKVCVIGAVGIDTGVYTEENIQEVESAFVKTLDSVGQAGSYSSRAFQALGLQTSLIGLIGNDYLGTWIQDSFRENHVLFYSHIDKEGTHRSVNLMNPQGNRKTFYDGRGGHHFKIEEYFYEAIENKSIYHFHLENWCRNYLPFAQKQKGIISVDLQDITSSEDPYRKDFIEASQIIFFSCVNFSSPLGILKEFTQKYPDKLFIGGAGGRGAFLGKGKEWIWAKPLPYEVKDTTGAGDHLAAGFLTAHLRHQLPWEESLHMAQYCAWKICSLLPHEKKSPSWEEAHEYILNHKMDVQKGIFEKDDFQEYPSQETKYSLFQKFDGPSDYQKRIYKVVNYISKHYDEDFSVEDLAKIACFSKFHFNRIFQSVMNESVWQYTKRIRLQAAATFLGFSLRMNLTEIAFSCGFSSSSHFSKAFKEAFGVSPLEFRTNCQNNRTQEKEISPQKSDTSYESEIISGLNPHFSKESCMKTFDVQIQNIPSYRVAYLRHIGEYGTSLKSLWAGLYQLSQTNGILPQESTICLGICWDDPSITPPEKCRYDACLVLLEGEHPQGFVGEQFTYGGTYATIRFRGKPQEIGEAYGYLFAQWMPQASCEPANAPSFELYKITDYCDPCTGEMECLICAPITKK